MFLISLSFILIVGIALWQIRAGLFSALITLILAVLSAMIAFTYYEPLAQAMFDWRGQNAHPMYMHAGALMGLFFVVQLALRFLYDMLIVHDVGFAMWPNRIGAGVVGLLVGMVQVGVMMIAVQMLPLSQSTLSYVAYNDDLTPRAGLAPFQPDRFVLGMVRTFSAGSLGVERPWTSVHDDYLKELFARRNQGWDEVEGSRQAKPARVDAPPNTLSAASLYKLNDVSLLNILPDKDVGAGLSSGGEHYVARVTVTNAAADTDIATGNWYRLTGTHFELIALVPNRLTLRDEPRRFYPIAFLTRIAKDSKWAAVTDKDNKNEVRPVWLVVERDQKVDPFKNDLTVDWVYLLPSDAKPLRLTFRGGTPVSFPAADKLTVFPSGQMLSGALDRR